MPDFGRWEVSEGSCLSFLLVGWVICLEGGWDLEEQCEFSVHEPQELALVLYLSPPLVLQCSLHCSDLASFTNIKPS